VTTTWRRAHRAHRGMTHAEFAPRLLPGRLARPPCLARRALAEPSWLARERAAYAQVTMRVSSWSV
jgi:hypothetical protein